MNNALREVGATLVAANLYPFGLFGTDEALKKHSKLAHNPRPIVLVHGIIHNRSAFLTLQNRMRKLGWENIYTINYSTFHGNILQMVEELSERVNSVLAKTGAKQVDIVAHSLGGLVSRTYMSLGDGRGKVSRLVTLGTPHQGTRLNFFAKGLSRGALDQDLKSNSFLIRLLNQTALPRSSQIISIYSDFDWTVWPGNNGMALGSPSSAIKNIRLENIGHIGLLYDGQAFDAVVKALID